VKTKTTVLLVCAIALASAASAVSAQDFASTSSNPSAVAAPLTPAPLVPAGGVLLIETTTTFLPQCLDDLGVTYDSFSGSDFSAVDLSGYGHVIVGMDGGLVNDPSIANVEAFATAGGALHFVGGTCWEPYALAVDNRLLEHDTADYCWTTVSGSPDSTVVDPGNPLAAGLPATYDFDNNSATYYSLRPMDAAAAIAAVNGDGYDHLLSKPIGAGTFDILTNSPSDDYWESADDYNWGCQVVQNMLEGLAITRTTFKVTKTFSDGNDAEVDVKLSCNSGLPLEQEFTIAGGDPEGVTFVVTDIPDSGATCEVTETGTPAGYTTVLNGGDGCTWEDVVTGIFSCQITNTANPATYTVFKDWTVYRQGGDVVLGEADVTIECDSAIDGGWEDDGTWYLSDTLSDGESLVASVDTTEGPATCSASEEVNESGVESSAIGCGEVSLSAGGSHTCTFTNTVFFEGIPTLSQYGLALLVLLTLGVGFITLRRVV
jgi:hypothetical protein